MLYEAIYCKWGGKRLRSPFPSPISIYMFTEHLHNKMEKFGVCNAPVNTCPPRHMSLNGIIDLVSDNTLTDAEA